MRFFSVLLVGAALLFGQEALNNEGIIELVKSEMSEELIVNVIRQQPGSYVLGATELVALKGAGVSEKLIGVMLEKGRPALATPAPALAVETGRKATTIPGQGLGCSIKRAASTSSSSRKKWNGRPEGRCGTLPARGL